MLERTRKMTGIPCGIAATLVSADTVLLDTVVNGSAVPRLQYATAVGTTEEEGALPESVVVVVGSVNMGS